MRFFAWRCNTLAQRFAITQVLAIAGTLGLIKLFDAFGGVWAKEPLEETGLLNEAADIARTIEAAPPLERTTLSTAAGTIAFRARWYTASSPVALTLNNARASESKDLRRRIVGADRRTAIGFSDEHPPPSPMVLSDYGVSRPAHVLAVPLADDSWLVFTALNRSWGLPLVYRVMIRLTFLGVSIVIVSIIAARQVLKPVKQLAEAVRRFDLNAQSAPIAESGPREIRNVIQVFNAMQAQIQKFVTHRTIMLATISHDLRTPLTRIRLRGEYIEDAKQQARLFRDVDEMQTMIDGALAFFRDDAIAEETTTFDVPRLLLTITDDYSDQGVEITYRGPTRALYFGRPFALKRAFTNIIDNAIKYATPPQIELLAGDGALLILILDLGPGIPIHAIADVFRPYYRLEKSRNRSTGGVGLGLTATEAIVNAHGGEVTLRNRPERGLEVRISLPYDATGASFSSAQTGA
jgi:signal transduction histidine kinase